MLEVDCVLPKDDGTYGAIGAVCAIALASDEGSTLFESSLYTNFSVHTLCLRCASSLLGLLGLMTRAYCRYCVELSRPLICECHLPAGATTAPISSIMETQSTMFVPEHSLYTRLAATSSVA